MQSKTHYGEFTLRYWINQICARNIILPPYQRHFVWSPEQVKALANSFSKDLFVPPVTIGHIDGKNIIIDGQQRLTSILLCYFGVMPKKEAFLKRIADIDEINKEDDDDIDDNDSVNDEADLPSYYNWSLNRILDKEKYIDELKREFANPSEYENLDMEWFDDDFLDNHYIGFAYIVPKDRTNKSATHKFFSTVFRQVNLLGKPLLKTESRKSLYFLDDEYEPLFDPDFLKDYTLSPQGSDPQPLDFVRILALVFEFSKRGNASRVLRSMKARTEEYYEMFIDHVIHHVKYEDESDNEYKADSSRFAKYKEIFPNGHQAVLDIFKDKVSSIKAPKIFKSIIDADLYFMGLTYWGLLRNMDLNLDDDLRKSLVKDLNKHIDEFRQDKAHSKSPGGLTHIRRRMEASIKVYGKYFDFSVSKIEDDAT